jgi:hypothetical protein
VGTLASGKEADIILLRTDRPNVFPINDPIGAVVWGMDTSNVDTVFIAGRVLKRDGQLVGVDWEAMMKMVVDSRDYVIRKSGFKLPRIQVSRSCSTFILSKFYNPYLIGDCYGTLVAGPYSGYHWGK